MIGIGILRHSHWERRRTAAFAGYATRYLEKLLSNVANQSTPNN